MANKYIIDGGKPLKGTINVNTAKNSAVAILCACLLNRGVNTILAVPRIQEVERIIEILMSIGVKVTWKDKHTLIVDTRPELKLGAIDRRACEMTRSSLLLLGALGARVKKYKLYRSGGCKLGARTVRPHLYALEKFGIKVVSRPKYYEISNQPLIAPGEVVMYESGDTPTENALLAAVLSAGTTVLKFCSSNYMVQDLCYFLQAMGAKIEGIGSTTLKITGVKKLQPGSAYPIMPDPIEAMAWIALSITTHSRLTVANCPLDFLDLELEKLRVAGQKLIISKEKKSANGRFRVADITLVPSSLVALPDKVYGRPYPGLNIDNLPFFVPILTQARGRTLIHDWVYENRAIYYLELQKLGAKITLLDPHRIFVEGKTKLLPNELMCPPAIRPAMAVLIAMLAAKGRSVLRNSYPIERGYEDLAVRLTALGAKIKTIN